MGFDTSDGSGGWGCVFLALLLLTIVIVVGVTYVDDWIGIQATKAAAALVNAEARRLQAAADREQAEAVRDVTGAVKSRMAWVNVQPLIPIMVVLIVLTPLVGYALGWIWPVDRL